ncbi:hypothetical protein AZE42_04816 [Rhizopogon vesiculosus]|uniref:EF-hand domain-containing protein n=1 Tax=Rhizopogon vesiculosus TaxID=180088 RepID=A0A1J8QBU9_9AGAM|nr:hypothetical protein AZE42_04816 [Rhizopogon vesiculosus]
MAITLETDRLGGQTAIRRALQLLLILSSGGGSVISLIDADRSGALSVTDLQDTLVNASDTPTRSAYGLPPGITFDRFVRACVTVKTLTETFQRADQDNDGWIQLNYEEF